MGFAGLEFAYGIPGTVGGAVLMNAGAWGREIGAIITGVTITGAEEELTLDGADLGFAYRCCPGFWQYRDRAVISAVALLLTHGEPAGILAACRGFQERRQATQPSGQPNAGSFFKNPSGDSAGRLIEASGCKGLRIGGAMVSPRHANFLVNVGGAKAVDVLELMRVVQDRVQAATGILLEPEVHFF
jgi:UDP-N-acetylmuramate dehydrogenase